ncbi:MAG: hypothetical protein PSV22_18470 [Pseudolabrys sp.]|nr:hypothetical protein [Pseudolabrys sp.]
MASALALAGASDRTGAKERKQRAESAVTEVKGSLFSGSESRLYDFGTLRADCTIPIADIRIVKAAEHGDVRFEEVKTVATANKSPLQKRCYGKPVDAVRMYYKANADFVGKDRIVVDMDSKLGSIWRVAFTVDVR